MGGVDGSGLGGGMEGRYILSGLLGGWGRVWKREAEMDNGALDGKGREGSGRDGKEVSGLEFTRRIAVCGKEWVPSGKAQMRLILGLAY